MAYGSNTVGHAFSINSRLPLRLQSFSVSQIEKHTRLLWKTTEEINVDKFQIDRSIDGKSFNVIATKAADRTALHGPATAYGFDDEAPIPGMNFYRLKMIDNDESFAFSRILSILVNKEDLLIIMPNPTSKTISVQGTEIIAIELLDKSGKPCLI